MKTTTIKIAGKDRVLCFSLRVMRNCAERYGDVNSVADAIGGDKANNFDEAVWILAQLMAAGAKHCAHVGIECAEPLSVDEILDVCDISDFRSMNTAIMNCMIAGNQADVEIETEKNAQTTPVTTA